MPVRLHEKVAIGAAMAFAITAVIGFAVFGLHPESLTPDMMRIYAAAFEVFAQGQVWVTAVAFAWVLSRRVGAAWVAGFALCYVLSLTSELLGTTYGIPFGAYTYSSSLGPMWLARVPIVIPISWFLMALPSYAMAQWMFERAWHRIFAGSLILLAWDLVLDPAMSYVTKYWVWAEEGPFFGMPLLNLFGWYVTGIALLGTLHLLRVDRWTAMVPRQVWVLFYVANLVVPTGMIISAGIA